MPTTTVKEQTSTIKPQRTEVGALWTRTSMKGEDYFTGEMVINGKKRKLVGFQVKDKKNDNMPDWRLYLDVQQPKVINKEFPDENQD